MDARGKGREFDPSVRQVARDTALAAGRGPIGQLVDTLALTADDVDFLVIVVACSIDPLIVMRRRQVLGDGALHGVDLATFVSMAGLDTADAWKFALRAGRDHPLIRSGLIEMVDGDAVAGGRRYAAPRRTIAHLAGLALADDVLATCGGPVVLPDIVHVAPEQVAAREALVAAFAGTTPVVLLVEGATAVGKRTAIADVARAAGRGAVAVDLARVERSSAAAEKALRALRREHELTGAVPIIAGLDDLAHGDPRARAVLDALDAFPGTVCVTASRTGLPLTVDKRVIRVAWPMPAASSRRAIWDRYLGASAALGDEERDELAYRYELGPGAIARAVATAGLLGHREVGFRHALEAIHTDTAERLAGQAIRTTSPHRWDDLVVSDDTREQIRGFTSRVRHALLVYERWGYRRKVGRATGASALFSGPPGTGKTMVAGLIASELGLEMYQVDLSKVVSKWVGETEKQLSQLFDAAAAGHIMLLFDEADALFAKRSTDVRSATDRYANLEVNYLLQRIEAFGGVSILTTNLDSNLDEALRRRLSAHVVFWPPDDDERAELWRKMLEGDAPRADDIDIPRLVRDFPDLSGAHIKNATVAAAFVAASHGRPITQADLEGSARAEYAAQGRILSQHGKGAL